MEERAESSGGPEGRVTSKGIPVVAEVLGYVGGALALAAVVALVAAFWAALGTWGRAGIASGLALAGLLGGFAIGRFDSAAANRLSQFLLLVGVVGTGAAVGFLINDLMPERMASSPSEWGWFSAFASAALVGGVVWWKRRTWMQHLAFGLGVGVASLLVLPLIPVDGPEWGAGAVLVFVGVAWGALVLRGALDPADAGLALSCLGILGGIELMALTGGVGGPAGLGRGPWSSTWALWLGLVVAIGLTVGGVAIRKTVVLGCGAAGVVIFAAEAVGKVFGSGIGAPAALLGTGLAIMALAALTSRRSRQGGASAIPLVSEIAGYVGTAFVFAGGVMLVTEFSEEIGLAGRIAVPALGACAAYAAATFIGRLEGPPARRLAQVLLGTGALAAAVTVSMAADPILSRLVSSSGEKDYVGEWTAFCGAGAGTLVGGVTWWLRRGGITLLVFSGAVFMMVQTVLELTSPTLDFRVGSLMLLAVGLTWVALGATERLTPSNVALAFGSFTTITGLMMLQNSNEGEPQAWAAWVGIAVSVAAIVGSIPLKRGVLLGFGAAGVVMFTIQSVMTFFEGQIAAPILLLVAGVVLIGMAVLVAVLFPRVRGGSRAGSMPAV